MFMRGPDPILTTLRGLGSVRKYPSGSYLFFEGDDSHSVLLVESGLLRIERTSAGGRTALLDLVATDGVVGELGVIDGASRSATAVTIEASRIRTIPASQFREVLANKPEFVIAILGRVITRMRQLTDQFVDVANRNSTERIADRLMELLIRSGEEPTPGVRLRMPITQVELGQWAGLSREGTTNALGELRESGIITTGRKSVVINRPDELRKLTLRN
jgi:CRP-like cAMP-binding protein